MDQVLASIVLERLTGDGSVTDEVRALILAAFEDDDDELGAVLAGEPRPEPVSTALGDDAQPAGAYLRTVTVQGFRGIGRPTTIEITPGPGLTLVVGRNGSGKSSLAEAVEVLLTGASRRWAGRPQVWKEGWRNLHHGDVTRIEAEFIEEGHSTSTTVRRTWDEGAGLDDSRVEVQRDGRAGEEWSNLGWNNALDAYRPFLSYNELGSMLDEAPSKLYDAMAGILGLDDLVTAERRLGDARRSREKASKDVGATLKLVVSQLKEVDDDRARRGADALSGKRPDLDAVALLLDTGGEGEAGDVGLLRQLATLEGPDPDQVSRSAAALRDALARAATLEGTDSDHARATAEILEAALALHEAHGDGDCPVCGRSGALDKGWNRKAVAEAGRLRRLAQESDAAHNAVASCVGAAAALRSDPPDALTRASDFGIDAGSAATIWADFSSIPTDDAAELAESIDAIAPKLDTALVSVRGAAAAELQRREDVWRPVSVALASWLESARASEKGADTLPALRKAEKWVKDASHALRNERFAPIAEEAARVWSLLRVQSNVDLGRVELTGSSTQRKVVLAVTVDGAEGTALGVMSQGELHSLALSLFLPRATLPESPFRFLVIDDPVQSMDPARVDGLARVLDETASRRQVVVLTHDDRLPEAIRRLGIDATVWEVARREGSIVEFRPCLDPVRRHLDDAYALARSEAELPTRIARQVVPNLCQSALEAACAEAIRRRRLGRGERHSEVEDLLTRVASTTEWAALALFDDEARGDDVVDRIKVLGPRAAATFDACASTGSDGYSGDLLELVRDARFLAEGLRGDVDAGAPEMATVLFTDIVSSAERAASVGDRRWRALLDEHHRAVGQHVARHRGVVLKETGDGVLATFDSPGGAVRAAKAIREVTGEMGLQVRAGIHTGEIERRGADITGMAVILARRICDEAEADRILVSRTVTDLMVGSGGTFVERGTRELKGVPGSWSLFELTDDHAP